MKYQIAIIGGGPAGYTAAEVAGKAGLSVVLFEKRSLGGVCLNEGCIPTKTLLYSAKVYDYAKHASKYAVTVPEASFDLGKIVARKSKVVRKLVLGIKAKLTAHQVNIVPGEATVILPFREWMAWIIGHTVMHWTIRKCLLHWPLSEVA